MKKVLGVFLGLIAVIVIGAIGVAIVSEDQTNPLNGAASEAKAAADALRARWPQVYTAQPVRGGAALSVTPKA